jgi:2-polyprenyl-3-methyl-5-hydroxy-6-metoxy-1,4-benzoquinol methylase
VIRVAARSTGADPLGLAEAYQRTAAATTAVRTGVADALTVNPATPAAVAQSCGCDSRGITALLGALVALGLAERDGDLFRLSDDGAVLARSHPQTVALIVEKEWFFYEAWTGLEQTIRDGHARIAPWRDRLRREPNRSFDFLRALDDLAGRFGGEPAELAQPLRPGKLLDVGGGAGSHAARLAAAQPGLEATVLDLPEVEAVVRERHPTLGFIAGDFEQDRCGRPVGEQWDAVLLANVLHDHAPADASRIVREAASLLRDGGILLVYEWALEESRDAPAAVAMFALMMMVENEGGAAYTQGELTSWLTEAGFSDIELRRGSGPIAVMRAIRS